MERMPPVTKCFGALPPRHATFLISIAGLLTGATGITGLVLYGLVEKAVTAFFFNKSNAEVDDTVKKCILFTIGVTSLMLIVASVLMFLGVVAGARGPLGASIWIIFAMLLVMIFLNIVAPLSCFFMETTCVVKKVSTLFIVTAGLFQTMFLEIWIYFMAVANSHLFSL